jgi:hypothetical protein
MAFLAYAILSEIALVCLPLKLKITPRYSYEPIVLISSSPYLK